MTKQKLKVWDAPTRLFHWLLVLALSILNMLVLGKYQDGVDIAIECGTAWSEVAWFVIDAEDLFDLLGQRPGLLQHIFTTLFGARRSAWGLSSADLPTRGEAAPEAARRETIASAR